MDSPINFDADLEEILKSEFERCGISYDASKDLGDLTTSFMQMLSRRISPFPRQVFFSEEIQNSLGDLLRNKTSTLDQQVKVKQALDAVFLLRRCFVIGKNVNSFLSRRINYATGPRSQDKLLWDFGMHHFHLSPEMTKSGFVERSDYLLFAIVTREAAYFVDVRPHLDPQGLQWVRQDLLTIVHSNWPELVEPHLLTGILPGTPITDEDRIEYRRSNITPVMHFGDAIALPLCGGVVMDGSSLMCRLRAGQLLGQVRLHQEFLESNAQVVSAQIKDHGIEVDGNAEFGLALSCTLDLDQETITALNSDGCLSKALFQLGFVVVIGETSVPVVVFLTDSPYG